MNARDTARTIPIAITLATLAGAIVFSGADWPQFRGPGGDGISSETGLLKAWPDGGPETLWRIDLGHGFSGISVAAGRVFTMFAKGKDEFTIALEAATGKEIWRVRTGANFKDMFGNGPRSTPTVDGETVYALSAYGTLHALRAQDGKPVWSRDLAADFGTEPPKWGYAGSPLIEGERLFIDVGGAGGSVAALDKASGKTVWRSHHDKAGYSTPIAVTIADRRQVVFFTGTHVVSLSPADGSLLWQEPWKTSYDVNAASPVFVPPDRLFISSGYDVGAALFRVEVEGVEEVWRNREMKNKFSSSVLHQSHLYGFDEKILKCVDVATGKTQWRARGFGHGSLLYADGHLIVLGDQGDLALVEATPEGYHERARAGVLGGKSWTMPTLAGGKLYLRDQKALRVLSVSE